MRRDRCSGFAVVVVLGMAALIPLHGGRAVQAQQAASKAAATPAGNAQNGAKIFITYGCWQCHGYSAQGGPAGSRLAPRPWPFRGFVDYVRAPGDQMPPYSSKVLKESELADIYAFLLTIPEPPAVKDIPLLSID